MRAGRRIKEQQGRLLLALVGKLSRRPQVKKFSLQNIEDIQDIQISPTGKAGHTLYRL